MDKQNGRPGAYKHVKTYRYSCMPLIVGGGTYDSCSADAIGFYSFQCRIHRSFTKLDTKPNRQAAEVLEDSSLLPAESVGNSLVTKPTHIFKQACLV